MKKSIVQRRALSFIAREVAEYNRKLASAQEELASLRQARGDELQEIHQRISILVGDPASAGIELPTLDEPAEAPTVLRKKVVRRKKRPARQKKVVRRKKRPGAKLKKKVAKKAPTVSKSQMIRDYLAAHPNAASSMVVAGLKMQGVAVTVAHVGTVKSQMKAARKKKVASRKK